jgi:hypothetical protein
MEEEMEWAFKEWERNSMEKFVHLTSDEKASKKETATDFCFWSFRNFMVYFYPQEFNFSS